MALDYGYCPVAKRPHNESDGYFKQKLLGPAYICRHCNNKIVPKEKK